MHKHMWEILVPAYWELDGKSVEIPLVHHQAWDQKVRDIAGGLTIMKPAVGHWVSAEGKIFRDKMIPVRIACHELQIRKIALMTLQHYHDEEVILVYRVSDKVMLFERSQEAGDIPVQY